MFSWETSKPSWTIIFRNFFICVEESNDTKDYLKVKREAKGNVRHLPFSHLEFLNIKYLLGKNRRRRTSQLAYWTWKESSVSNL